MTHKELVNRAYRWIRDRNMGCTVAMKELKTWNSETPDVVGFWAGGKSMLIECKTSRNDFLADRNKHFRENAELGMGDTRYFLAERGIIKIEDLIDNGWGLLNISEHQIREVKESKVFETNKNAELTMIVSVLRGLEISATVFVRDDHDWYCGCGHWNGSNLAVCAMCGRTPGGI